MPRRIERIDSILSPDSLKVRTNEHSTSTHTVSFQACSRSSQWWLVRLWRLNALRTKLQLRENRCDDCSSHCLRPNRGEAIVVSSLKDAEVPLPDHCHLRNRELQLSLCLLDCWRWAAWVMTLPTTRYWAAFLYRHPVPGNMATNVKHFWLISLNIGLISLKIGLWLKIGLSVKILA